jgi:hypothetical protein
MDIDVDEGRAVDVVVVREKPETPGQDTRRPRCPNTKTYEPKIMN